MTIVEFTNRDDIEGYGCRTGGDQAGKYVPLAEVEALIIDRNEAEAEVARLRALLSDGVESLQFGGEPKTVLGRAVREFTEKAKAELAGAK